MCSDFLGGIPIVPSFREGPSGPGPFAGFHLAGAFGATLLPSFFGLWKDGKSRFLRLPAWRRRSAITVSVGIQHPLLAYVAGILAVCLWPVRGWSGRFGGDW